MNLTNVFAKPNGTDMADLFISYSKQDPEFTETLVADLEARGYTTWWDTSILPGEEFWEVITAELDASRAVIVIWTANSIQSKYVRAEGERAHRQGKLIMVHARGFSPNALPLPFSSWQCEPYENRSKLFAALAARGVKPSGTAKAVLSPGTPGSAASIGKAAEVKGVLNPAASAPGNGLVRLAKTLKAALKPGPTAVAAGKVALPFDKEVDEVKGSQKPIKPAREKAIVSLAKSLSEKISSKRVEFVISSDEGDPVVQLIYKPTSDVLANIYLNKDESITFQAAGAGTDDDEDAGYFPSYVEYMDAEELLEDIYDMLKVGLAEYELDQNK